MECMPKMKSMEYIPNRSDEEYGMYAKNEGRIVWNVCPI